MVSAANLGRRLAALLGPKAAEVPQPTEGSEVDARLPTKQLGHRSRRASDLFPTAIVRSDVATADRSARVLAQLLDAPELELKLASIPVRDRARFEKCLASFAMLADSALTALDYRALPMGWDGFTDTGTLFPENRDGYRERAYRPDYDRKSDPRRERSKAELKDALAVADSQAAIEKSLAHAFCAQIGFDSKSWKPTLDAISNALDQELFIPLRALADATLHLDHRGVPLGRHQRHELDRMCREVVEAITKHVVEGDFDAWRFEQGAQQLEFLSPEQIAALRTPTTIQRESRRGRTLTTRDEQGAGLMWVTKIGGPSHGFDMLSQCLIALLANPRNNAIVVDEDGYPGAARSVIRLLPRPDGKPVLYVEMLQEDFPHGERSNVAREELRLAILEHAVAKARAIGADLVLAPSREPAELYAEMLGFRSERTEIDLVLHPSAGVFEASDSLLGPHHMPQTETETVHLPRPSKFPGMDPPKPLLIYTSQR
jgi:hypothetical protein